MSDIDGYCSTKDHECRVCVEKDEGSYPGYSATIERLDGRINEQPEYVQCGFHHCRSMNEVKGVFRRHNIKFD